MQNSGLGANSADGFAFNFTDASGQLEVTKMTVTLGSGMIYDLTALPPGYLSYGPYVENGGGTNSTQVSPNLGEGTSGNRTISWSFNNHSFTNGVTFGYGADVDEDRSCNAFDLVCQVNADSIAPAGFIERGGIDLALTVAFKDGSASKDFTFPGTSNTWNTRTLGTAATTYAGDVNTPEPATWMMGIAGIALCALARKQK